MIREFFTFLTTPCPRPLRAMGYLYEAAAISGRYGRHQATWEPHLDRSRRCIIKAASACVQRRKAVVFGSGLLLDCPVAELAHLFREVVFVDIIHIRRALRQGVRYDNVRFAEADVTGIVHDLYKNVSAGRTALPEPLVFLPEVDKETDFVVSLNLMAQLPVLPVRYVSDRLGGLDDQAIENWSCRIAAAHYQALAKFNAKVLLITDNAYRIHDRKGTLVEEGPTMPGLTLPEPHERWSWPIAPLGEQSRRFTRTLLVGAWRLGVDS
ncbi:MAG: hypothetical protein CSYNP_01936 [Syntrophus sp. SKADARSKE-3]|nr:hypothetical protein [Syntrophus sp. SKADARSKE-3]